MLRIVVYISGRGSNLKALFNSEFHKKDYQIVGVVCDNPNAAGLEFCKLNNLDFKIISRNKSHKNFSDFNKELINAGKSFNPNLIVLAGFMRIISKKFIEAFNFQIVNIHPSLLPSFKGLDVQKKALDAGVKFSGCTVHAVIPDIDSGEIICQAVVPILPEDSVESLSERILKQEHIIFPKAISEIAKENIKINPKDGKLSFKNKNHLIFKSINTDSFLIN